MTTSKMSRYVYLQKKARLEVIQLQFNFHSSYQKCGFPTSITKKESLSHCLPIIPRKKKGYTRVGNTHPRKKCARSIQLWASSRPRVRQNFAHYAQVPITYSYVRLFFARTYPNFVQNTFFLFFFFCNVRYYVTQRLMDLYKNTRGKKKKKFHVLSTLFCATS